MLIRNKRILRDIKDVITDDELDNIYYMYDDDKMDVGYALIYGMEDTPYAYGCYLFKIEFPLNYPFEPPLVTFMTGDSYTRFHPNFYVKGQVCLSILNTWPGERWSACQSLLSVLLNLLTLLDSTSLLYEPGISKNHIDFTNYHTIISYKNIEIAILHYLDISNLPSSFKRFHPVICDLYNKNKHNIILNSTRANEDIRLIIYNNMSYNCNFEQLLYTLKN